MVRQWDETCLHDGPVIPAPHSSQARSTTRYMMDLKMMEPIFFAIEQEDNPRDAKG